METEQLDDHLPPAKGATAKTAADKAVRAPRASSGAPRFQRLGDRVLFLCGGLLLGFAGAYLYLDKAAGPASRLPVDPHAGISGMQGMPGMPPGAGDQAPGVAAPAGAPVDTNALQKMRELELAAAKTPGNYDVWVQLGNAAYDANEHRRAIEAYEKALAIQPGDANVMTDLGVSYRNTGNVDKALATFQAALKANPDHWQALFNQIIVYGFDKKELPKARELFAKLKKEHPTLPMLDRLGKELEGEGGSASK